jgi:integrase
MQALEQGVEAKIRILQAQAQFASLLPPPPLSATQTSSAAPAKQKAEHLNLRACLDAHYQEEVAAKLAQRTLGEKRVLFDEFVDCFGDVPIATITELEVNMRWRPAEFVRENKKYAGKKVSGGRLEKRRTFLSKFFKWAIEGGRYPYQKVPVEEKMATKKAIRNQTQSYVEFNGDDLAKLFRPQYAQAMSKPDFYWLPLIALFSGARLGEIADLLLADFAEVEGIKVFEICKGKTKDSQRTVPIHSRLLTLGLWDYVQSLKSKGLTHFVPFRPLGSLSKRAGDTWAQWVEGSGITNKRKTFHSFRSTAITDLHNGPAQDATIRGAVGHASQNSKDVHNDYIRGIRLVVVKDAVESLSYPTIDFSAVQLADPTFSAFIDGEIAKAHDPQQVAKAEKIKANRIKRAERESRVGRERKAVTPLATPVKSVLFTNRKSKTST